VLATGFQGQSVVTEGGGLVDAPAEWIPVYEILEQRGFEVLLVNARDTRNVPGRKTDVNDAQWLQQLHQHGLLRGSFRPRPDVARLRAYLRPCFPRPWSAVRWKARRRRSM
jgi:Transposase